MNGSTMSGRSIEAPEAGRVNDRASDWTTTCMEVMIVSSTLLPRRWR
jgi:hypothetical protein